MNPPLWVHLLQLMIFPGTIFLFLLAFFYEWADRKFFARVQNRYGPLYAGPSGILQPIADFLKLLSKEDIVPRAVDRPLFASTPILYPALLLTALFVVPIASPTALVLFEGDLIFLLFLFTLSIVMIFLAGYGSGSRFGIIGSVRAALQLLGYEIPMGLAVIGPAISAGSLSLSRIVEGQQGVLNWTIWLQPLGFLVLVVCLLAELEFVPFDIPEAETEIVAGWETEFSGRRLALFRLGKNLKLVLASSLLASLYLGGAQQIWILPPVLTFLAKTLFIVLFFSLLRSLFARFRIDQMLSGTWKYIVPLAVLQIVLIKLNLG